VMTANLKFIRYVSYRSPNAISTAKEIIKYIEVKREHHRNTPELFNEAQDHVRRQDFLKEIRSQPERGICIHHWKLSLHENERNELKIDMREWTRDFMARVEAKYKQRLDWVAAIHDDEGHPHVHIIIRGRDREGGYVNFYRYDSKKINRLADEEKRLQAVRNLGPEKAEKIMERLDRIAEETQNKKERMGIPRNQSLVQVIGKSLTDVFAQILHEAEWEREQARRQAQREAHRRNRKKRGGR